VKLDSAIGGRWRSIIPTLLQTPLLKRRRPRQAQQHAHVMREHISMDESGPNRPRAPLRPSGTGSRQPFTPCNDIVQRFPAHLAVQRFLKLPAGERNRLWMQRRAHAPCSEEIPTSWGLDALYLRHPSEREYCDRLRLLSIDPAAADLSSRIVCYSKPWVPHHWPWPQHRIEVTVARFPLSGDLPDPTGGDAALDCAWRLRQLSIEGGTGEPGRILAETKKEHRDARKFGYLVPYHQVEFCEQIPASRDALYVRYPDWWQDDAWVSQHMFVPTPACVTYRASRLLLGGCTGTESKFWWLVFEAAWVTLFFGR
jgi:hypothetical protein